MFTKWIKKLQNPCEEDINKLNEENKQLKQKLIEKQEHRNSRPDKQFRKIVGYLFTR